MVLHPACVGGVQEDKIRVPAPAGQELTDDSLQPGRRWRDNPRRDREMDEQVNHQTEDTGNARHKRASGCRAATAR